MQNTHAKYAKISTIRKFPAIRYTLTASFGTSNTLVRKKYQHKLIPPILIILKFGQQKAFDRHATS